MNFNLLLTLSGFDQQIQEAGARGQVRARDEIINNIEAQRGRLFLWLPVFMAFGIGLWLTIRFEPTIGHYLGLGFVGICAALTLWLARVRLWSPLIAGLIAIVIGFLWIGLRAHLIAEPVLTWRYYGPVEGRIVAIDRSASDKIRLTLDQVVLDRVSPARTPDRVRVSLHGDQGWLDPEPGQRVVLTGHLSPPSGPVEPGGFDFQRIAYFRSLGAVGYTRTPVLLLGYDENPGLGLNIYRMRMGISDHIRDRIPGDAGAFAAAITTGDRSAMSRAVLDQLRATNLAHLLAISGLHMGLLTGFVFAALRSGLALIPAISLRAPTKKVAAIAALIVGAIYLSMSGGNVATERAFIMVSVMFVAILLNRRALTLRAVAIAALIVLIRRPEELSGPGFQMSFAATTALVATFSAFRSVDLYRLPKWARPILAVFLSSLIAGLATAPFGAAHFNQISQYGLIANLLSVPIMGGLIMPCAVIAACLAPFGLEMIGLWGMEIGLRWILFVADQVGSLDGAIRPVKSPSIWVLPLLSCGFLFLILWNGRPRLIGLLPVFGAFVLWVQTERPLVLVSDTGGLIGIYQDGERILSSPRGDGFAARVWLENDGSDRDQESAGQGYVQPNHINGVAILNIRGQRQARATPDCAGADIVIMNIADDLGRPCEVYDPQRLRDTGSLALFSGHHQFTSARDITGPRLWNTPELNPALARD